MIIFEENGMVKFNLSNGEYVEAIPVLKDVEKTLYITVDCLQEEHPMERGIDSNANGYEGSSLRTELNDEILSMFPGILKKLMIPFENGDYLRLPTEKEIFGKNEYGEAEDESVHQFECMKLRRNRIAFQGYNGDWEWYWLQNRSVRSAAYFAYVNSSGNAYNSNASNPYGVRPLFQIKNL